VSAGQWAAVIAAGAFVVLVVILAIPLIKLGRTLDEANTQAVTGNVSALTSVFTATLGGPLVKVAAFSYGVNRALKARRKAKAEGEGKHSRRSRRKGASS
jgi:hypothetical protein